MNHPHTTLLVLAVVLAAVGPGVAAGQFASIGGAGEPPRDCGIGGVEFIDEGGAPPSTDQDGDGYVPRFGLRLRLHTTCPNIYDFGVDNDIEPVVDVYAGGSRVRRIDLSTRTADPTRPDWNVTIEDLGEEAYAGLSRGRIEVTVVLIDDDLDSDVGGDRVDSWEGAIRWEPSEEDVNHRPHAAFVYTPDRPIVGDVIRFDASASSDADTEISSYRWDFDDDGTTDATGVAVEHAFERSGTYRVSLTVTDGAGGNDTVERPVTVVVPDTDEDGLDDFEEESIGTDPRDPDTDGDGLTDRREVMFLGTDPLSVDTDGDGVSDRRETRLGTNPTAPDTDGDGLNDSMELDGPSDPLVADTDGDGATDGREVRMGTDPTDADSDGDGIPDGRDPVHEMTEGMTTPANESSSDPDGTISGFDLLFEAAALALAAFLVIGKKRGLP